jgi:hypothetical protein
MPLINTIWLIFLLLWERFVGWMQHIPLITRTRLAPLRLPHFSLACLISLSVIPIEPTHSPAASWHKRNLITEY